MRCLALTLLTILVGGQAAAQCGPPPGMGPWGPFGPFGPGTAPVKSKTVVVDPEVPDEVVAIIPGTARMTTRLTFVIDTSSSMSNSRRVSQAIVFARDTLGLPGDDLLVTMYAFKEAFKKWPGLAPDPSEVRFGPLPPKGWTEFPGVPQQQAAQEWLSNEGASGGTNPNDAMVAAITQDMKDLTVVLITDGQFYRYNATFVATIEAAQQARLKKGYRRATIFIVGTGEASVTRPHMIAAARRNGGGLHVIRPARPKQEEKKPAPRPATQAPPAKGP